jgi:hypothetical protein
LKIEETEKQKLKKKILEITAMQTLANEKNFKYEKNI